MALLWGLSALPGAVVEMGCKAACRRGRKDSRLKQLK